jgi:hypothetical protein
MAFFNAGSGSDSGPAVIVVHGGINASAPDPSDCGLPTPRDGTLMDAWPLPPLQSTTTKPL